MLVQQQSVKDTHAKFEGNPTNGLVADVRSQRDGHWSPHKVFFFHNAIKPPQRYETFFTVILCICALKNNDCVRQSACIATRFQHLTTFSARLT